MSDNLGRDLTVFAVARDLLSMGLMVSPHNAHGVVLKASGQHCRRAGNEARAASARLRSELDLNRDALRIGGP
jgi:hypothetical protein